MISEKKKILRDLYIELVKLQKEVINSNLKLIVIIEGRDAAGKDGTIKKIIKHLSPRETKVVALGKSSEQKNEWYFERYSTHLPSAGELVFFNRSWYNRAGVEKVMGFCDEKEYESFFPEVESFEKGLVEAGFIILKYYLDISKTEQEKRLAARAKDPLTQWKISLIDNEALKHWKDYSQARNKMLLKTNFTGSPWFIVNACKKKVTHNSLIIHFLQQFDYPDKNSKSLVHDYGLVYSATPENIKDKTFE